MIRALVHIATWGVELHGTAADFAIARWLGWWCFGTLTALAFVAGMLVA